jgi:hypothetical protein
LRTLRAITDRATGLSWSRAILEALFDELHIDDLFMDLVGNPKSLAIRSYPQAIVVALALRHSWRNDDLSALIRRLKLPPPRNRARSGRHRRM